MALQALPRKQAYTEAFVTLVALWLLLLAVFHAWPSIDIAISGLFFSGAACLPPAIQKSCGLFTLRSLEPVIALRWALYALPYIAAAGVIAALLVGGLSPAWRQRLPIRRLWLSLASLAIGTGLITNLLLKSHSGRPRPFQTGLFGGSMDFMPAGSFQGACERNCSFISGEASGAGWLICLLFLLPPRYRLWVAPPVIIASAATVGLRVAIGAHYASDVMLGWLMPIVVFAGLLSLEQKASEG